MIILMLTVQVSGRRLRRPLERLVRGHGANPPTVHVVNMNTNGTLGISSIAPEIAVLTSFLGNR